MRVEHNFVNNEFVDVKSSEPIAVYNPDSEQQIAQVTAATSEEVLER